MRKAFLLLVIAALFCGPQSFGDVLIAPGATWRYNDTGTDLGTSWLPSVYDDSGWSAGPAQLGYGDGDESTVVSYGGDPSNRYPCTYFRQSFSLPDASLYLAAKVKIIRDDGAVVYVNGTEVFRSNMPTGTISYGTWASTALGGTDETAWVECAVDPGLFVTGTNVVAAEVHQANASSTDVSFDLELDAYNSASIIKGPYLQNVTQSSMVVMWETDLATASQVEIKLGTEPSSLVSPTPDDPVLIHEVLISGLTTATTYDYRVSIDGNGMVWSDWATLTTAPASGAPFRLVAYGDTRTNTADHAAVIQSIIASDPDVVIHVGDLVGYGREYSYWEPEFFTPAHDLMLNVPMFPVLGNHEYEGSGPIWFFDLLSLPHNEEWFAFTYGCVRFMALNTADESTFAQQYAWMLAELQSDETRNACWRFVYFHNPVYSSGAHANEQPTLLAQQYLVPLFEQNRVSVVFYGHDHLYERSARNGIEYVLAGGGGAPLRAINVNPNPYQVYAESVLHHCVLDITCQHLSFVARRNDGSVLDSFEMDPPPAPPPEPVITGIHRDKH